jgi:hypothetical protein
MPHQGGSNNAQGALGQDAVVATHSGQDILRNAEKAGADLMTGACVNVVAGTAPHTKKYYLHVSVLCIVSPWFTTVLMGKPDTVFLLGHTPRICDMVVRWIYGFAFSQRGRLPHITNEVKETVVINELGDIDITHFPDEEDDPSAEEKPRVKQEGAVPFVVPQVDDKMITPLDLINVYILAAKLQIPALMNDAIDELYDWFHPSAKEKPTGFNNCKHDEPGAVMGRNQPKERYRRCPRMVDVAHAFKMTSSQPKCKLRTLLVLTTVFFLFSERPQGRGLPIEWKGVMEENGEIGFMMLSLMASWKWEMGKNCPDMSVRAKCDFHESLRS